MQQGDDRLVIVDEIPVFLAVIPRPSERGVEISVANGELHVDALA
jgi:hypothetical protein